MTEGNSKLVVTHVISGDLWAGAEVQVYNLCQALQASGQVTPTVVLFNEGILFEKFKELGIPLLLADEKKLNPWTIARSIASHCKEHNSKIVHTHGFKENVLGILGNELAKVPRSARTVHGSAETVLTLKRPHKWLVQKVDLFLGRTRQQAIIAVSTQLEDTLKKVFQDKVYKIFNFIDIEGTQHQWLTPPRGENEEPKIGLVGRLVKVKRGDLFIRTIALLNQQGITCRGVVVGSGPLENDLRQLAFDLNIAKKIDFKGFLSPALDEIVNLDVLLMPSDHEGLPMTLLEALAVNVPIVAHNVGGIPEVLDYGKAGILVDEHTPEGYAESVKKSLALSLERRDLTPKTLLDKFSAQRNVKKYITIYHQLTKDI